MLKQKEIIAKKLMHLEKMRGYLVYSRLSIIDPARLCLKSVRLESVERCRGSDKLSPNGVNTSPFRINSQNYVIPAQAGIQLIKNPLQNRTTSRFGRSSKFAASGSFVRFAGRLFSLDSGLHRNDGLMDYLGLFKRDDRLCD